MLHTIKKIITGVFICAIVFLSINGLARADSIIATVDAGQGDGNLVAGDIFRIWFGLQSAYNTSNLVINGPCTINGKDVSSTLTDMTDGNFIIDYAVSAGDTARAPGTIPFSCSVKAEQDNATTVVSAFTSTNSVSVNWTDGGGGDNTVNTSSLSSAITSTQTEVSGAVVGTNAGNYPQSAVDGLSSAITTAQGVLSDVSSTQAQVNTATSNLNISLIIFHSAQVQILGLHIPFSSVTIMPDHSMRSAGYQFGVDLQAGSLDDDMIISGECTINTKNVASSLENLTEGLYHLTYTVGASDPDAVPGQIPIFCSLYSPSTHDTVSATTTFTNSNTAGVDADFISNIHAISTSATSETITFTTAVPTTAVIEYTLGNTTLTTSADSLSTSHSILITGLASSTTYLYEIIATDASDAEGTSAEGLTFTTGVNGGDGGGNENNNNPPLDGTVDNGGLAITSITPVSVIASADATFEHGWKWVFNVTVPFNETNLQMKFDNWTDTNSHTIAVENNMRISSTEASSVTPVMITSANTYSTPLALSADRDPGQIGRQIQITVEMRIPTNAVNGLYSSTYGIQSNPNQI